MLKRWLLMLAAVVTVVAAIALFKVHQIKAGAAMMQKMRPPPIAVATIGAAEQVWQRQFHAVGSLAAVEGVTVSNELAGTIEKIAFESGNQVRQGDLLVQFIIAPDEAQVRGAEAQATLARLSLSRAKDLRTQGTNAQSDLDVADAQFQQATALVDNLKATIAKKVITAPFSGQLGIRQVNIGQFLPVGTPIVTLQALDPLYVNFALPQQDVVGLSVGQKVQVRIDAYPTEVFGGVVSALNSKVDDATRNLEIQAMLPNADGRLKPGMFGSVDVLQPNEDRFITLPQSAIVYNPYGNAVYVVEQGKDEQGAPVLLARQRFVQLGETRGDQVAVLKGVAAGEQVVTAGQLKLRNGAAVQINNSVQPENSAAPTPSNT
jgi:membrane fusion protein (multidrug efflux system)